MKKLNYLEGMRALMAINVILCHFVCVYYPQMYFEDYYENSSLSVFSSTPLSVFINGSVAVVFFFALTGFLVGMSVFVKDSTGDIIWQKIKSRYLLFLPVIAFATLFTFLTMKLGLQFHLDIDNPYVNTEYLSMYCNFDASIGSLILNIFYLTFWDYSAYIGPFWTISYEFIGYIIVLITAVVLKKSRIRRIVYIVVMLVMCSTNNSYYAIFIMGLFVADLQYNQYPTLVSRFYAKLICNKVFSVVCLIISVYFACCPMCENYPIYSFWFRFSIIDDILLRGFGMALFILSSSNLKFVQRLLSIKPLVFLGERSFEVYAIHWPIMLSLETWVFLVLEKHFSYDYAALLSFAITLPVIYVSSYFLNLLVKQTNKWIDCVLNRFKSKSDK